MKLLPILALLSSLALIAAANTACVPSAYSRPTLEVKHDKFRPDSDSVQLSIPDGTEAPSGPASGVLSGKDGDFILWLLARPPHDGAVDDMVFFRLSTVSMDGWRYLRCHSLAFLIDGEAVDAGETKHDGTVGGRSIIEYVSFVTSLSLLDRMAQAREVEGKLCGTEFRFKPDTLRLFAAFVSTVRTGVVPPESLTPAATGESR